MRAFHHQAATTQASSRRIGTVYSRQIASRCRREARAAMVNAGQKNFFRSMPVYSDATCCHIAIEHQRLAFAEFHKAPLGGLAPARMIDGWIHCH